MEEVVRSSDVRDNKCKGSAQEAEPCYSMEGNITMLSQILSITGIEKRYLVSE